MIYLENYIDGELQPPINGRFLDNYNPSKGVVYSQIPDSDKADVQAAVVAAHGARPGSEPHQLLPRWKVLCQRRVRQEGQGVGRVHGEVQGNANRACGGSVPGAAFALGTCGMLCAWCVG